MNDFFVSEDARLTRCRFDGDDAPDAPRAYALPTLPRQANESPERARGLARGLARAALLQCIGDELRIAPSTLRLTDQRGEAVSAQRADGAPDARLAALGLSLSHEDGVSLLALLPGGAVGVDVVACHGAPDGAEQQRIAELFLGQKTPPAPVQKAPRAIDSIAFVQRWAQHEAALKCIGHALVEWTPALAARLEGVRTAPLVLPAWAGGRHVGAVAWRCHPAGAAGLSEMSALTAASSSA